MNIRGMAKKRTSIKKTTVTDRIENLLSGKSAHTQALLEHFILQYKKIGTIEVHPAKTMIGIATHRKRIAYVTQLGKNFVHVVFMFERPYEENLCFQKIA